MQFSHRERKQADGVSPHARRQTITLCMLYYINTETPSNASGRSTLSVRRRTGANVLSGKTASTGRVSEEFDCRGDVLPYCHAFSAK